MCFLLYCCINFFKDHYWCQLLTLTALKAQNRNAAGCYSWKAGAKVDPFILPNKLFKDFFSIFFDQITQTTKIKPINNKKNYFELTG